LPILRYAPHVYDNRFYYNGEALNEVKYFGATHLLHRNQKEKHTFTLLQTPKTTCIQQKKRKATNLLHRNSQRQSPQRS